MDEFQKKFRQTEPNSPARIATQSVAGGSQLTLKLRHKFPKIKSLFLQQKTALTDGLFSGC